MKNRFCIFFLFALGIFCASAVNLSAQFKQDAFTQTYADPKDSLSRSDTTDKIVDFHEIFGGLAHKRKMRIGTMFGTSIFIPGASQIYNRDYWKLPIYYTGIVGGLTAGSVCYCNYKNTGNEAMKPAYIWSFVGAGLFYYASLMEGAVSYKSDRNPLAGRATIYSILCPGLGQAYNKEYWKIPIYVGGIVGSLHFYFQNKTNYIRYRDIYRDANQTGYSGPITADQAKYYRDEYRRYRDYSMLATVAFYLLQVIDANVFCYMNDFDVSDNVTAKLTPSVIMPDSMTYSVAPQSVTKPAAGLAFSLEF